MLSTSCVRCGASLPAVPADPTHPDWCAACAARALASPGTMPPPAPSVSGRMSQAPWTTPPTTMTPAGASELVIKTRVFDGILTGTATAFLAGVAWWAIATNVDTEWWHFGAIVVGLVVGQGVLLGSRRGGLASGIIAVVVTTLAVLAAVYFIDRTITLNSFADAGRSSDIPLWQGFSHAKDVYQGWWDINHTKVIGWALAPIAAVIVAGWPGRRPLVG
ncbi:hypothetical protein [Aquihabitans sp. McL0605]|uniref:hypothetical protein n=1 Tax=Aquihabitans sp. McL0605 TaxID=3415671 RepID=UPI003CF2BEB0